LVRLAIAFSRTRAPVGGSVSERQLAVLSVLRKGFHRRRRKTFAGLGRKSYENQ